MSSRQSVLDRMWQDNLSAFTTAQPSPVKQKENVQPRCSSYKQTPKSPSPPQSNDAADSKRQNGFSLYTIEEDVSVSDVTEQNQRSDTSSDRIRPKDTENVDALSTFVEPQVESNGTAVTFTSSSGPTQSSSTEKPALLRDDERILVYDGESMMLCERRGRLLDAVSAETVKEHIELHPAVANASKFPILYTPLMRFKFSEPEPSASLWGENQPPSAATVQSMTGGTDIPSPFVHEKSLDVAASDIERESAGESRHGKTDTNLQRPLPATAPEADIHAAAEALDMLKSEQTLLQPTSLGHSQSRQSNNANSSTRSRLVDGALESRATSSAAEESLMKGNPEARIAAEQLLSLNAPKPQGDIMGQDETKGIPADTKKPEAFDFKGVTGQSARSSAGELGPKLPIRGVNNIEGRQGMDSEAFTFRAWPKPPARDLPAARIRKVQLLNLPPGSTFTTIQSMVFHGGIEAIMHKSPSSAASVYFLSPEECMRYYHATSNGIIIPRSEGKSHVVFVELAKDVDVIGGMLRQYIANGITRCVRAVGVEADWTQEALLTLASEKGRKVEKVELHKTGGGMPAVTFRFCNIQDSVRFKAFLDREEDWEGCNIHHASDPCATATGVHLD